MVISKTKLLAAVAISLSLLALGMSTFPQTTQQPAASRHTLPLSLPTRACADIEQTAVRLQTAAERVEAALAAAVKEQRSTASSFPSSSFAAGGQVLERCVELYNRDLRDKRTSPFEWEVMMTPEIVAAICGLLSPEASVMEWGTGGSTVLFSGFVKEYWAIEHDKPFGHFVRSKLLPKLPEGQREKIHYFVVPNDKPWSWPVPQRGTRWNGAGDGTFEEFESYLRLPSGFRKKFDLILIDGRARVECARAALVQGLLKSNGYILIHDWERSEYHRVLEWYDLVQEVKSPTNEIQLAVLKAKSGAVPPPYPS